MLQVYFKPEKRFFEFWKRNRFLKADKDYLYSHGRIVFAKPFKGKLEFTYDGMEV